MGRSNEGGPGGERAPRGLANPDHSGVDMYKITTCCSKCGKVRMAEDRTHNSYCADCWRKYQRDRWRGDLPPLVPRSCENCGESFVPGKRDAVRSPARFCSKPCQQEDRISSGRQREAYLRRTYGIGIADYERMLAEQGGGCALCGVKPEELTIGRFRTYLHVDHDAVTGRVRGLLCPDHNLLIGRWNHDPALLRRAAAYLEATAS